MNNIFFTARKGSRITSNSVTAAGLSVSDASGCVANYNCYYDHESSNLTGIPMGISSFESSPRFQSNYSLMADSPCIDAGGWVPEVTSDIEGATRPMDAISAPLGDGSDFDIGSFEYPGDSLEQPNPTFTPTSTPTITPTPTIGPSSTPTPGYFGPDEYIAHLPGGVTMEFIHVAPGRFNMGGDPNDITWTYDNEIPRHEVEIDYHFYLGKYEVTQAQWLVLMGNWPGDEPTENYGIGDRIAAYYLSWDDCQNYLSTINALLPGRFRLPSEAEWEYACRAGTTTRFYFGNNVGANNGDTYVWDCNVQDYIPIGIPFEIGTMDPNPWGFYDILGNICEWCQDSYHSSYMGAPTDGSAWFDSAAQNRVIRAQYVSEYAVKTYRCAKRDPMAKDYRGIATGFRLLLEAPIVDAATPYGDVDGDGQINFQDSFLFSPYWQQSAEENETSLRCNPILDEKIDEQDLLWLLDWW